MGTRAVTGTPDRAVGQAFPATRSGVPAAALPPVAGRRGAQVSVIPLAGPVAGLAVRSLAVELAEVALASFGAPPWNETPAQARQLVDRMLTDAQRPGVVFALGFTGGGMRLVGFGYGLPRWPAPGSAAGPLPFAGAVPFEFCELAVGPAARGLGTGRALHDAVLATSGPQPRWLVTHPAARPAVGLYQASGWQISRTFRSAANGSSRLLMTRRC